MSHAWPTELRARLYDAAAKGEETVSNPVRISIAYPREEITILESGGTQRTISVPPCTIVLTKDQLTPVFGSEESPSQPSSSSQTRDASQAASETMLPPPPCDIVVSTEGASSGAIDDYVHVTGGISLPPDAFAVPQFDSGTFNVETSPCYPPCHGCTVTSVLCENTVGFPCGRCIERGIPCIVTPYPQAPEDANVLSINPRGMADSQLASCGEHGPFADTEYIGAGPSPSDEPQVPSTTVVLEDSIYGLAALIGQEY